MKELPSKIRYLVFKYHDLNKISLTIKEYNLLNDIIVRINEYRDSSKLGELKCVVIESDWDCYEAAWELLEEEAKTKVPKQAFLLATEQSNMRNCYYNYSIVKATSGSEALAIYVHNNPDITAVVIAVKEGNNFKMLGKTIPVPFEWLEKLTQTDTTK